jgi:AGZA family xanthine/uracil permease-like MFS transporter
LQVLLLPLQAGRSGLGEEALGFIGYPIIKLFSGKGRELGWLTYVLAVVLVAYFVFVRSGMR